MSFKMVLVRGFASLAYPHTSGPRLVLQMGILLLLVPLDLIAFQLQIDSTEMVLWSEGV